MDETAAHLRIVVVGGGQAGLSICESLRKGGHHGRITLVCGEPHPPYQRPPLSKAYLAGEFHRDRLFLKPGAFYEEQQIDLQIGKRCVSIDTVKQTVLLADGTTIGYDRLALATGCWPRPLPPAPEVAAGAASLLRGIEDSDAISSRLGTAHRLLVVGGGYIGLEIAATARKRGAEVIVIEAAPRLLGRVAGPETATRIHDLHTGNGVRIRTNAALASLEAQSGGSVRATLADGSSVEADFAVAGVGAVPQTALAERTGLDIENGIRVDEFCRTSNPRIFAAGDCTSFPFRDGRIRLESVQNAIDQGKCAAANMLGANEPFSPTPWFWSDQYDSHLQIAGISSGADATVIRPGDRPGAVSIWYFAGTALLAVDAIDDPRPYMIAKRLLESGKHPDPAQVADPGTNLKSLLR